MPSIASGVRWDLDPAYRADAEGIVSGGHFDKELRRFGLNPSEMRHFWPQGYSQPRLTDGSPDTEYPTDTDYIYISLARILELEDAEPGLAASLRATNGIRNFGRGNLGFFGILARNRSIKAARSVGFAVASHCDNASLTQAYPQWVDIALQRLPDTAYDFVEIADVGESALLERRTQSHGSRARMEVLGVHAHSDGRRLGLAGPPDMFDQGSNPTLGPEHLDGVMPVLGRITMAHTSIVLDACHTGMPDGLAERLHKRTGLTTIAPPCEAATVRFDVREDRASGVLVPDVAFVGAVATEVNSDGVAEVQPRVLRMPLAERPIRAQYSPRYAAI